MLDDSFTTQGSVIHRLDPRPRIIVALAFSVVMAVATQWSALAIGAAFSILILALARLPFGKVLRRLILVNGLILVLWFLLPLSVAGDSLFAVGPFGMSREGICYAALLTARSNIIVLGLLTLISTIPMFTLGRAMATLRIPDKGVQLFLFTYRYVHVIHEEYLRLLRALKIRGFEPGTNLHTYRTYAYLVGMLLLKSYERSVRIRQAMLCRGFHGKFYNLSDLHMKRSDWLMAGSMLLAVGVMAGTTWAKTLP